VHTDPKGGSHSLSLIVVPTDIPGLQIGPPEKKMGLKGSPTHPVTYQDVRVPEDFLLGEVGQGLHQTFSVLDWGRVGIAALSVGLAQAAFEEGFNWHILLISGRLQGNNATGLALQYIEAIKAELGWDYVPGNFNGTTPPDFSEMDRLHEAGLLGWGSNLEVWNPDVFRWMCPGKHRTVGRERWIEGLKHAVSVFGRGNVYSLLIMGLENKDSFLEGVKAQSEMGVVTFNANWNVVRGSKLEGHRAPHPEELAEWNSLAVDIMEKYLPEYFTPELFTSGSAPACYRCVQISTHLDEMRRRTGHTIVMPNDSGKKLVYVDRDRLLVGSPYAKVPGKAVCP